MESPRPSSAETFVDNTTSSAHTAGDRVRLMEEFTLDPNPLKDTDTAPPPIPRLYTTPFAKINVLLTTSRIAIIVLNITPVFILVWTTSRPFELAPLTVFTTILSFVPTLLPLLFHLSLKKAFLKSLKPDSENGGSSTPRKDAPGAKRTAVLVEDPLTGEERWMLEPVKKKDEDTKLGRVGFLVFDLVAAGVLMIGIPLCFRMALAKEEKSGNLGWILGLRLLMMVLLVGAAGTTWWAMSEKETKDRGTERGEYE